MKRPPTLAALAALRGERRSPSGEGPRDAERTGIDAKANRRAGRHAGRRDSQLPEEAGGSVAWGGPAPLT